MPVSEIPALSTKKGGFRPRIAVPMIAAGVSLLGGWGVLPQEKIKICASKMPYPAFWDHSQWKIVEIFFLDFLIELK